jgi:signal recognition particle receptor subunit beta
MDVNFLERYEIPFLESKGLLDILDIPGQGYFKARIIENLANAKLIIVLIDSNDKDSIKQAGAYLYDILNNEQLDDTTPLIIACNKQDLKFPKSKKIIESDLNSEIESIKQMKQKNNLEDTTQMGALFSMRSKFNFNMFKNVYFVETDKTTGYQSLIKLIDTLI